MSSLHPLENGCRGGGGILLPLAWTGNYTLHFHSHSIGQNLVTWQHLAAKGTGKCGLYSRQPCGPAEISLTMGEGENAFHDSTSSLCYPIQLLLTISNSLWDMN